MLPNEGIEIFTLVKKTEEREELLSQNLHGVYLIIYWTSKRDWSWKWVLGMAVKIVMTI